jgi:hypothetical protein
MLAPLQRLLPLDALLAARGKRGRMAAADDRQNTGVSV